MQRSNALRGGVVIALALASCAMIVVAGGNQGTDCSASQGPDVIVGDLHQVANYDSVGAIEAFAVGTTSCNIGDEELQWNSAGTNHPVIGQNMFRLDDDRLVQIGQSFLKHGFTALQQDACGCGCAPASNGGLLGVGCSDPYNAVLNGDQDGFCSIGGLGPKFEVNPDTGAFSFPYTFQCEAGDSIYKRLQVRISDLDPAVDGGGMYFVEGHYVTPDDAAAGHQDNNASYRQVTVSGAGTAWDISLDGMPGTRREQPGIRAWADHVAGVEEVDVHVPDDGLLLLAALSRDLGNGMHRYEYAVQNLNMHRAVRGFSVPIGEGVTVTNVGFHDVDYHSGEPFDGTDWPGGRSASAVTWTTDGFAADETANALRWGTMYNFWFDADEPPATVDVVFDLFRPGTPATVTATIVGPRLPCPLDLNDNDEVGFGDLLIILADWGPCGPECPADVDGSGEVDFGDLLLVLAAWGFC